MLPQIVRELRVVLRHSKLGQGADSGVREGGGGGAGGALGGHGCLEKNVFLYIFLIVLSQFIVVFKAAAIRQFFKEFFV